MTKNSLEPILDFIDGKPFGAGCLTAIAAMTCYVADMSDWRLITLPLLCILTYWLVLQGPTVSGSRARLRSSSFPVVISARQDPRAIYQSPRRPVNYPDLDNEDGLPTNRQFSAVAHNGTRRAA
jgi:hypothetical protein